MRRSRTLTISEYNNVNQLTARSGTGPFPVRFRGRVNEPATVKVNGEAAEMKQDPQSAENGKLFGITLELPAGSNTVTIEATDFADPGPNVTTDQYAVNVVGGEDRTYSYDLNGNCTNCTSASGNVSYEWDAEDRLVAFSKGNIRSEFTYDGFGRRVMIVEKTNDVVGSVKRFVWSGTRLCQERDATGANVTKQFFDEGQVIGTANYFYTRDHLGSIREMTGPMGPVRARYDYDPYGRRVKLAGDVESDFGFTGHYYHAPSGLHLALYRAYDAETGRWLSRDPINDLSFRSSGTSTIPAVALANPYLFLYNNPIYYFDPLGTSAVAVGAPFAGGCAAIDGPLPIGDIVAVGILTVCLIIDVVRPKPHRSEVCPYVNEINKPATGKPGDPDYYPAMKICVYKCPKLGLVRRYFPEGTKCPSYILQPFP